MVPDKILPARVNQHVSIIRVKSDVADPNYVLYCLNSPHYKRHLLTLAQGGATREALTQTTIRNFEISIPPLPTQRRIAAILSAYDDLIENNTRRIALLERMAQLLYREWFVHFRFPGHEDVAMVASKKLPPSATSETGIDLKMIPEEWEFINYSDLLDFSLGGGWGPEEPTEREICPVLIIRGTDFEEIHIGSQLRCPTRYITKNSFAKRKLQVGDIVVENSVNASSRCVGSSLLITQGILDRTGPDVIAASFCKVFRLRKPELAPLVHSHLKYLHNTGKMKFYQNIATNGIGNFQGRRFVGSEAMPIPNDRKLLYESTSVLGNLFAAASNYAERNDVLRRARDLLLPRLISGEVNVSELDIALGGSLDESN